MVLSGKTVREIHKRIYEITIKQPKMFLFMSKVTNKMKKVVNPKKSADVNAEIFLLFMTKLNLNGKIKKLINHEVTEEAEEQKDKVIKAYIKESRDLNRYIYLASSHNDCAKDHIPYQGHLYYDENAPDFIVNYAKRHGYHSIQWVMGEPAWFITRPNCRHFFKSLPFDVVKDNSIGELQRRYKTHRKTGDRRLSTPKKVALEEYEDRLKMLKAMYKEHATEILRRQILKTEILIKKWRNAL